MKRFMNGLVVSGIAVAMALTTSVLATTADAAAPAPTGGGISLRPAHPDAASPSYFTLHVAAGASVQDAVVVTNPTAAAVSVIVSPVDGLTGKTSGAVYANRQDPIRKAGAWVTPSVKTLTMAAQSVRRIDFTVRAPAGATAGDHLAGIAFENAVTTTSTSGFPITEVLRSVIGVLIVVPGAAAFHPSLSVLGVDEVGSTGIGAVDVGLGNSGLLLGKPTLTVALSGPHGYEHSVTRTLDTVLPGDAITYPFNWPDRLAVGTYSVKATLTGGGASVTRSQGVHLGKQLAGTAQPLPAKKTPTVRPWWQQPQTAIGAGLVLVALAALYLLGRRRGRRRGPTPVDSPIAGHHAADSDADSDAYSDAVSSTTHGRHRPLDRS